MRYEEQALTVAALNQYIKALIERDEVLSYVTVCGEISNLKVHTSGHIYFTLKDEESEISGVMFRFNAANLSFAPKNGMKVKVYGKVSVYEKSGKYQLYATAMIDDGMGRLRIEYELLYKKLEAEGLFAKERKKPIPKFPKRIGIVTSPTGAAIQDMLNVTGRRFPNAEIVIYPSLVQGSDAPPELCRGIAYFNADASCDVIIIGRGGGSAEDLWAFNDESLARMVAASEIPVISAVGHEIDFTLCDFAADLRAPTPSAAAEIVVPDRKELILRVDEMCGRLDNAMDRVIEARATKLIRLKEKVDYLSPEVRLERIRAEITHKKEIMEKSLDEILKSAAARLSSAIDKLEAINPLAVLKRGYAMAEDNEGNVVGSVEQIKPDDRLKLTFSDGYAEAEVYSVRPNKN